VSTRLICFTIWTSDGLLWQRSWSSGFRTMGVNFFWVSGELLACQGMSVSCSRHAALPSLVGAFPVRNAMLWWPDCTKWNQSAVHQLYRSLSDDRRWELAFEMFCNLRLEEWHKQLNLSRLFKYRPSLWTIVNWRPIFT